MATIQEKLAESLAVLKSYQDTHGDNLVIQGADKGDNLSPSSLSGITIFDMPSLIPSQTCRPLRSVRCGSGGNTRHQAGR